MTPKHSDGGGPSSWTSSTRRFYFVHQSGEICKRAADAIANAMTPKESRRQKVL